MSGKKIHKRLIIPKGFERVKNPIDCDGRDPNYERLLAEDFQKNRAQYIQIEQYGVPIWVKVRPIDPEST